MSLFFNPSALMLDKFVSSEQQTVAVGNENILQSFNSMFAHNKMGEIQVQLETRRNILSQLVKTKGSNSTDEFALLFSKYLTDQHKCVPLGAVKIALDSINKTISQLIQLVEYSHKVSFQLTKKTELLSAEPEWSSEFQTMLKSTLGNLKFVEFDYSEELDNFKGFNFHIKLDGFPEQKEIIKDSSEVFDVMNRSILVYMNLQRLMESGNPSFAYFSNIMKTTEDALVMWKHIDIDSTNTKQNNLQAALAWNYATSACLTKIMKLIEMYVDYFTFPIPELNKIGSESSVQSTEINPDEPTDDGTVDISETDVIVITDDPDNTTIATEGLVDKLQTIFNSSTGRKMAKELELRKHVLHTLKDAERRKDKEQIKKLIQEYGYAPYLSKDQEKIILPKLQKACESFKSIVDKHTATMLVLTTDINELTDKLLGLTKIFPPLKITKEDTGEEATFGNAYYKFVVEFDASKLPENKLGKLKTLPEIIEAYETSIELYTQYYNIYMKTLIFISNSFARTLNKLVANAKVGPARWIMKMFYELGTAIIDTHKVLHKCCKKVMYGPMMVIGNESSLALLPNELVIELDHYAVLDETISKMHLQYGIEDTDSKILSKAHKHTVGFVKDIINDIKEFFSPTRRGSVDKYIKKCDELIARIDKCSEEEQSKLLQSLKFKTSGLAINKKWLTNQTAVQTIQMTMLKLVKKVVSDCSSNTKVDIKTYHKKVEAEYHRALIDAIKKFEYGQFETSEKEGYYDWFKYSIKLSEFPQEKIVHEKVKDIKELKELITTAKAVYTNHRDQWEAYYKMEETIISMYNTRAKRLLSGNPDEQEQIKYAYHFLHNHFDTDYLIDDVAWLYTLYIAPVL